MNEATNPAAGTTTTTTTTHAVEKKDLGTKVKEGAKNAVEKVRRLSDELVKKIKGKPKEEGVTTTPEVTSSSTTSKVTAPTK